MPSFSVGAQAQAAIILAGPKQQPTVREVIYGQKYRGVYLTDDLVKRNFDLLVEFATKVVRRSIGRDGLPPERQIQLVKSNITDSIEGLKKRLGIQELELVELNKP